MDSKIFTGTYTALITPFKNNKIDEVALEKIINYQIDNNIDGIVICGTTGESPTLSYEEHNLLIELAVQISNKRITVIAGTGSNSTSEAIDMSDHAQRVGADALLVVSPYYNKPNQEGIYQHFYEINKVSNIPIIIYNIPGRCIIDISDKTICNLSKLSNISAIKDATGDVSRVVSLRSIAGDNFSILSGEDSSIVGFNAMGGDGVISVLSNIIPKLVSDLQKFCVNNNYNEACKIQRKIFSLTSSMFCEVNPIPVKYASSLIKLCEDEIRLPLISPSEENKIKIKKSLLDLKIIS